MKLNALLEQFQTNLSYGGFNLHHELELEEDNRKIWHEVSSNGKRLGTLDHSPYQYINEPAFKVYVDFFKKYAKFPDRSTIDSIGPLNNTILMQQIAPMVGDR